MAQVISSTPLVLLPADTLRDYVADVKFAVDGFFKDMPDDVIEAAGFYFMGLVEKGEMMLKAMDDNRDRLLANSLEASHQTRVKA